MAAIGIFDRESGPGIPKQAENICRSGLDMVRPQLFLLRDEFFTSSYDGLDEKEYRSFLKLPLCAGYVLGLVGEYMRQERVNLSESEMLRAVIDTHNHFYMNDCDLEISLHFMTQQEIFKFGMCIGKVDVHRYLEEQARTGRSVYALLATASMSFFQSGDTRTLKLSLESFCKAHNVPLPPPSDLRTIMDRWRIENIRTYR